MAKETRKAGKKKRQPAANGPLEANGEAFVVRALAKGLAMLSLFDAEHREWTLDEMVAELKLPRMTGYRMARTLQSAGYLVTDPQSGRYRLGPALIASTYLSEGYAELVAIARPYLESLVAETGESATLAVDVDGVAVCVDMLDSPRPHKREVAVGRVIGDTANAHGKMYAASVPDADRERLLAAPHERLTPKTITDPEELAAELQRVRDEGVAFDIEERNLGTCAVAAPIRDQMGAVIGSIGVIVPTGRFGPDERETCVERGQERGRRAVRLPGVRRSPASGPSDSPAVDAAAAGSMPAAAASLVARVPQNGHLNGATASAWARIEKVIWQYHSEGWVVDAEDVAQGGPPDTGETPALREWTGRRRTRGAAEVDVKDVKKVAVVGAGTMGPGLAQVFACAGHAVSLYSRSEATLEKAMSVAAANMETFAGHGLLSADEVSAALARITHDAVDRGGRRRRKPRHREHRREPRGEARRVR